MKRNEKMKKSGIHYAWFVCAGCAVLLFCTSGLAVNAFTIYQPYIMELNGFTNTQTSSVITFRTFASLITMLLSGVYYKKLSLRGGMTAAGLCTAAGFAVFGAAKSYPVYCSAAVLVGLGYGLGTMIPIALVLKKWFVKSRNLAIGACSAATGLSTLGIPSLLSYGIERIGLNKTFFIQAAVMTALTVIAFLLIRSAPEDKDLAPYGGTETGTDNGSGGIGLSAKENALLLSAVVLVGGVMSVAYCHLSVLITGEGYSPAAAAAASSFSGLALMLGKISFGRLGDKISNYKSNYLFGTLLILGCSANCFIARGEWTVYVSSVLFSAGMAFTSVGLTTWAVDLSAPEKCERNIRLFQTLYSVGTLVFSPLPGIIADRDGGSYVLSYAVFAVLAVYILFAVQYCYRKSRRKNFYYQNGINMVK